jgi:ABC-2 type transport system ATP-binding protein
MLLEARNIVKQYAGHLALDEVNIHVPQNSIYGLLGPNGAGKTTLIRILNGIINPDSGEALFKGKRLQPQDVKHIGYLPEERGLYKKMRVGEQVLYLARLKGLSKEDALKKMKYWFDKLEIDSWRNRPLEELSKGMQQKVQFTVTVLHEPELLIFDEPFSGFDPLNAELLKQEILELRKKGATILLSTHDMFSVEELCENIALLNKSKVILEGKVSDIRKKYAQSVFILKTQDIEVSIPANDLFQVVSVERKQELTEIKIKRKTGISNNDLIREILPYCSVFSFEEELPGMNEIFIKEVTDKK